MRSHFLSVIILVVLHLNISSNSVQAQEDFDASRGVLVIIQKALEEDPYSLHLDELDLVTLPPEIGQLHNLHSLSVSHNRLSDLPPELGQLQNLRQLVLTGNQLTELPSEIGQLSKLQWLDLSRNQFVVLPPEIGELRNLCYLDLRNNNLTYLPQQIGYLTALTESAHCMSELFAPALHIKDNPLTAPLSEIANQGTAAVLAYLRDQTRVRIQQIVILMAVGIGLMAAVILGFRHKQRLRKLKRSRRTAA